MKLFFTAVLLFSFSLASFAGEIVYPKWNKINQTCVFDYDISAYASNNYSDTVNVEIMPSDLNGASKSKACKCAKASGIALLDSYNKKIDMSNLYSNPYYFKSGSCKQLTDKTIKYKLKYTRKR